MDTDNPYLPVADVTAADSACRHKCWLLHECAFWIAGVLSLLQLALMGYRILHAVLGSSQPPPANFQLLGVLMLLGVGGLAYLAPRWYFRRGRRDLIALGLLVLAIFVGHSLLV